jgi:hypothetical protein
MLRVYRKSGEQRDDRSVNGRVIAWKQQFLMFLEGRHSMALIRAASILSQRSLFTNPIGKGVAPVFTLPF